MVRLLIKCPDINCDRVLSMSLISSLSVPRRILIGVSGGIAAYKICQVVSSLAKTGAEVKVILTDSAQQFITPLTFA